MNRHQKLAIENHCRLAVECLHPRFHWVRGDLSIILEGPQLMGIEMIGATEKSREGKVSCTCGECHKCKHREYMRRYRPNGRLAEELKEAGFSFNEKLGIWTVERS